MSQLHFLILEGNTAEGRKRYAASSGAEPSAIYAGVMQNLAPSCICDIAYPADADTNLPNSAGLADYDGVIITGSALNIEKREPESLRQIELARAVFAAGVPFFGSCWGLQVATVAAGGDVRRNPAGREVGIARAIRVSASGATHPLLEGRTPLYEALATHEDYVATPAPGMAILAGNAHTPVQAAEIRHDGGTFWGVQYHPEFTLGELAGILERLTPKMLDEGFYASADEAHKNRRPDAIDLEAVFAAAKPRLEEAAQLGCVRLQECTPDYLGRSPRLLRRLADATGIDIWTNTGWYAARDRQFLPPEAATESAAAARLPLRVKPEAPRGPRSWSPSDAQWKPIALESV